ncbi:hypothetical protein ARMGADRAFT_433709 [Armillaria gallica]|uniref:Uncharacterized protein n=1 Tax=Armillaria gallica TaxID=47427 RepID=A0A2H3DH79_ARMGA|nr:hypothetical protein ARMGADRAFT_433709 [Armillaria gallica]
MMRALYILPSVSLPAVAAFTKTQIIGEKGLDVSSHFLMEIIFGPSIPRFLPFASSFSKVDASQRAVSRFPRTTIHNGGECSWLATLPDLWGTCRRAFIRHCPSPWFMKGG